jgi:signal transduction histidine kinase
MSVLAGSDDRRVALWPVAGGTPTRARSFEELELLVARSFGGHHVPPEARQRAHSRALALLADADARDDVSQASCIGFIRDLLAELLVELAADLPALTRLIHRLATDTKLCPFELGRELVRTPHLLRLPPTVAIDVELKLLLAFTQADLVSLWRLSSHDRPEPIAFAGEGNPDDARTRRFVRGLLGGQAVDPRRRASMSGLRIDGAQTSVALVSRGGGAAASHRMLLLEAAMPVLAATLLRDVYLSSSAAHEDADRKSAQLGPAERRLARVRYDLHDGPQQDLMLLAEDLRLFRSQLDSVLTHDETRERVMGRFDDLEAQLVAVDGDLRRISVSSESPFLQDESLPEALAQLADAFAQRTGIKPRIDLCGDFGQLTDSQHITLLGLIREALGNVREHADAGHVSISLSSSAGGVEASVTDDGRGFEPETMLVEAARQGHLGLVGMHERVRMLGGETRIDSRPGGPTVISVSLPPAPVTAPRRAR